METETLKKIEKLVTKCMDELAKKNDINPNETAAAKDGLELIEMIKCKLEEEKMQESGEYSGNYSGHQPYRRYNIAAYGHPDMAHGYNSRMMPNRLSMGDPMNYSGGYGVHGWYDSDPNCHEPPYMYDDGTSMRRDSRGRYSRHSIADRVVSLIEHNVMSGENSEFENEEARKLIRLIRQNAD